MIMSLKLGDVIYIHGFKNEKPEFFCLKHFKDLIGFPTRVFLIRNDIIYVTHPTLDVVPLSDNCIDYELLDDVNLGGHRELKNMMDTLVKMGVKKIPRSSVKHVFKESVEPEEGLKGKDKILFDLIQDFNDNEIDLNFLENFVGGLENFISILKRKGWLHLIDPFSNGIEEDIQNSLFYAFYQNDKNFIWKIVDQYLSDITKVGDEYYYDADYSDLASLFNTGRNDISEESIAEIISGEYEPWRFGDYNSDDVYSDVYEDLKPENKKIVDDTIISTLKSIKTLEVNSRTSELIDEINEEQGNNGTIELNDDVINRLMNDEDSMKYLINRELDGINGDLDRVYSGCYSDTLVDEWYNDLWNVIEGDVVDSKNGEDYSYKKNIWLKDGTRGSKTVYGRRFKVTKCLYNVVSEWLTENKNKNGYSNNTIEYFGSYYNLVKDSMEYGGMEWLRVPNLDDFPDFTKMRECMNYGIRDYF